MKDEIFYVDRIDAEIGEEIILGKVYKKKH